jgi:soluble lytic murein transglycosylase-like protein
MQRSNFVGEVRALLMSAAVVAGMCVGAVVCLNGVSAREYRGHSVSHARYAGHHLMPMAASNAAFGSGGFGQSAPADGGVSSMAAAQASAAGIPASLVARVIQRESGGNPGAVHAGNYGLMQIRLGTARAMGYTGSAAGLLDPQTNMTYAVRYLAGAYHAAGGNESRAVALYASGYYGAAKARGFSPYASSSASSSASASAAASVTPAMLPMAEPAGAAPVYRVRHYRRHAV